MGQELRRGLAGICYALAFAIAAVLLAAAGDTLHEVAIAVAFLAGFVGVVGLVATALALTHGD